MAQEMNLSAQIIYEKEFHVDVKGYAPTEVDEFLDQVIEDYQNYDEKVEELSQAVIRYEEKIKELQQRIHDLEIERDGLSEKLVSAANISNTDQVDVLKRLARLEAAVFGQE